MIRRAWVGLLCFFTLGTLLCLPVSAGGVSAMQAERDATERCTVPAADDGQIKRPEEYLDELFSALPDLAKENGGTETYTARVQEALGVEAVLRAAADSLSDKTPKLLTTFCALAGAVLLFAVAAALREQFSPEIGRAVDGVMGAGLVLFLYSCFSDCFERCALFLTDMRSLSDFCAPLFGGLYLTGGNVGAAAAGGAALAGLSYLLEHLCAGVLLPLCRLFLGFLLVGAFGEVKTDGMVGTIRNLYTTVLGFSCMLLTASLSLRSTLGNAADSVGMRAMKFAVGSMIPMVGSTVSGSLATLSASLSLIRTTAGGGVVAVILFSALPLILELLLARLALSLLASLAGLFDAAGAARLFHGFRSLFDLCLAAVVFSSILFIFIAASLMKCAAAAG